MITSVGNPVVRRVRRLRKQMWRERTSRVLVEGYRAVRSAVSRGAVEVVLYSPSAARARSDLIAAASQAGARTHEVGPTVMAYLTSATTAPDMLAVAPMPERRSQSLPTNASGLILSHVRDPATLGSIMASSVAVGAPSIVIGPGCVDVFSPKCLRAAQGAHFVAPPMRADDLEQTVARLREGGSRIVAVGSVGPAPWNVKLSGAMMLLVPGEGSTGAEAALADEVVALPAGGIAPSLSARVAVVLYEWVRQGGARV